MCNNIKTDSVKSIIKRQFISIFQRALVLIWLSGILLIDSCQGCNNNNTKQPTQKSPEKKQETIPTEVIVFCGNPGVGKSTLCNSIFQKPVFKSGLNLGGSLTTHKQEYLYEKKLYIDTPGLYDYTIELQKQAAEEIEKALKHNNNYKIVFVVSFNSGYLQAHDFAAIEIVCEAIKTDFEYGIIFNQVSKKIFQRINQGEFDKYITAHLKAFNKKPAATVILKREDEMEGEDKVYFGADSENGKELMNFLSKIKAKKIVDKDIGKIDMSNFQQKVVEMELKFKKLKN